MTWTINKESKLVSLIKERVAIENNPKAIQEWSLSSSWFDFFNLLLTENQKQSLLDKLILDRRPYILKMKIAREADVVNIENDITLEDNMGKN